VIDAKDLDAIAEAAADNIVEIIKAMGLKPSKKAEGEAEEGVAGKFSDEQVLQLNQEMSQEIKDFLRARHGEETWAAYEADIERMRGGE